MAGQPNQTIVQTCAVCGARFQVYATVREALCPTCGATNQIGVRAAPRQMPGPRRPVRPAVRPRVVLDNSAAQSAQSWLVLLMFAIMFGLGGAVYFFRDRIWPKPEKPIAAPTIGIEPVDVGESYPRARQRLFDGDRENAKSAAQALRELDGPGVAQPLRNWITFHSGLAHLLAGEGQSATDRFNRLRERAEFSKEPAQAKLVAFFTQCAAFGSAGQPIPIAEAEKFARNNSEAMGLLLCGLKNWTLADYDGAGAFFAEFSKATPEGDDEWVGDFKTLADGFVTDRNEWRTADEAFTAAKDAPDKQAAALEAIKAARTRLQTRQFEADLAKMEATLTAAIATRQAEQAKMMSEQEIAETALLADLQKKTEAMCLEFRFAEAQAAARGATVATAKRRDELKLLQKRMDSLLRFKRNLAADFAALGYRGGIVKRDGKTVPGEVRNATDAQIESVPWLEAAPDWLMKAAAVFIDATARLDYKADRQFDLGVFALLLGKREEADAWMTKAGEIKYEYKDALMQLLDAPAK